MISFVEIKSNDIKDFVILTSEIWHEYWTCILSNEQIDYMVDKGKFYIGVYQKQAQRQLEKQTQYVP